MRLNFCFSDFDPDSVTPVIEMNTDLRQQNTITILYEKFQRKDLRSFHSILTFLDIKKVSNEVVSGGHTVMQLAASEGLHEFVQVLLQGRLKIYFFSSYFNTTIFF